MDLKADPTVAPPGTLTEILITLARIEERQQAASANADHRHANLKMALDAFVPRAELEQRHKAVDKRLDTIEGNMNKAAWAIIAAWVSGLGVVATLVRSKVGLGVAALALALVASTPAPAQDYAVAWMLSVKACPVGEGACKQAILKPMASSSACEIARDRYASLADMTAPWLWGFEDGVNLSVRAECNTLRGDELPA